MHFNPMYQFLTAARSIVLYGQRPSLTTLGILGLIGVGMMNMASGGMMGGVAANAVNPQINPGNTQAYDPYANQAAEQLNQARAVAAANVQSQASNVQNANFCPNCGNPTNGSNFCPNCGAKLK